MPILVPALREGRVVRPRSVPAEALMLRLAGSDYTYYTADDLFAASLPPELGTNVFDGSRPIDARFAGMHYHSQLPPLTFGTVRNVDCVGCLWCDIEPAPGDFRWSALDALVAAAAAAGRDVVYCLLGTPRWASARPAEAGHYGRGSNAEPFDAASIASFAAAVCSRYRAIGTPIRAVEIWNEPKFAGGGGVAEGNYFSGTPEALAGMARAVHRAAKAVDPALLVLSPSPTGFEYPWVEGDGSGADHLDRFLGAGDGAGATGAQWVDVVAFHAYSHDGTNNLQALPTMLANVRRVTGRHGLAEREVWITETSAITPTLFSYVPQRQREYIARCLLLALGAGVSRVVWYAWDDPLGFDQHPSVAAEWNRLIGLLAGARLERVNLLRGGQVAAVVDGRRLLF